MSKAWQGGSTRDWRKRRAAVLLRDGYTCRVQLPGCTRTATHAHHTHGRAVTGDDPRYMVAACEPCNLAIGEPDPDPPAHPVTRWWLHVTVFPIMDRPDTPPACPPPPLG